jgi:hypothetical protein
LARRDSLATHASRRRFATTGNHRYADLDEYRQRLEALAALVL